jgi:PAS domain S-box-containing protein
MSNASILIVEDEGIVAKDIANKLGRLGYTICGITARGEEALVLARDRHPDLVLMDIRLAGKLDGVETADSIQRECDLPVIYLTAHADRATLERAKNTMPFGYLLKPFETLELETHIQMAIHKHQAEQKLRQQREWLEVTLHSIGDAVITTDAAGKVTSLNPVAEELTGWPLAEAMGRSIEEVFIIINEETRQPAPNPVERSLTEGKIVGLANHSVLVSRQGKESPIDDSAAPIKDTQGRILGAVMVFHDVSENRRKEELLRQSNATYAAINQILHAGLTSSTEEVLARTCLESAEKITQSKFGFIGEINKQGLLDITISSRAMEACNVLDATGQPVIPKNLKIHGIYGHVLKNGRSLFTNNPDHHPDRIGLPTGHLPLNSFLGAPLIRDGIAIGMIAVANREGGYTQVQQDTMEALVPAIVEAFMCKRAEVALCASNKELEAFNRGMVGRELRMIELKKEIDELCVRFGLPPRYGYAGSEKPQ